jgi:hypothetical protein
MPEETNQELYDRVARLERDLERLTTGVRLLGIKSCSWCSKFLRSSDPATLFDTGTPVCYSCVLEWWHHQCNQLTVQERENIERALKIWLLRYHHAEVIKNPQKLPKEPPPHLQIVVSCNECHATGYVAGTRCGYCDGRGTVWIVVRGVG